MARDTWLGIAITLLVLLFASTANAAAPRAPHVPEPMHFDLVRSLGPERGELEVNALGEAPLSLEGGPVELAPELEWAPTRDLAIELELPTEDLRLHAVKLATQLTFRRISDHRVAHGLQLAAAFGLHGGQSMHGLHVLAVSLGRHGGLVTMAGPRVSLSPSLHPSAALLVNAAVFAAPHRALALGLEANFARGLRTQEALLLPQVHVRLARHVRLQLGVGARHGVVGRRWNAVASVRLVVER